MPEALHVSKSYDGKPVIVDFSMNLAQGGRYCLMGPSGCGKTTLLRLLMGLEKPDSGQLRGFAGLRFSAVFQENRLLEQLNAIENVRFACPAPREEIEALLMSLGLEGDELAKPVAEFSGGMKRRVALCRALLADYDLLLLDEPYKGLDDDTRDKVLDIVTEQTQGKTVVLVTHDRREAEGYEVRTLPAPTLL